MDRTGYSKNLVYLTQGNSADNEDSIQRSNYPSRYSVARQPHVGNFSQVHQKHRRLQQPHNVYNFNQNQQQQHRFQQERIASNHNQQGQHRFHQSRNVGNFNQAQQQHRFQQTQNVDNLNQAFQHEYRSQQSHIVDNFSQAQHQRNRFQQPRSVSKCNKNHQHRFSQPHIGRQSYYMQDDQELIQQQGPVGESGCYEHRDAASTDLLLGRQTPYAQAQQRSPNLRRQRKTLLKSPILGQTHARPQRKRGHCVFGAELHPGSPHVKYPNRNIHQTTEISTNVIDIIKHAKEKDPVIPSLLSLSVKRKPYANMDNASQVSRKTAVHDHTFDKEDAGPPAKYARICATGAEKIGTCGNVSRTVSQETCEKVATNASVTSENKYTTCKPQLIACDENVCDTQCVVKTSHVGPSADPATKTGLTNINKIRDGKDQEKSDKGCNVSMDKTASALSSSKPASSPVKDSDADIWLTALGYDVSENLPECDTNHTPPKTDTPVKEPAQAVDDQVYTSSETAQKNEEEHWEKPQKSEVQAFSFSADEADKDLDSAHTGSDILDTKASSTGLTIVDITDDKKVDEVCELSQDEFGPEVTLDTTASSTGLVIADTSIEQKESKVFDTEIPADIPRNVQEPDIKEDPWMGSAYMEQKIHMPSLMSSKTDEHSLQEVEMKPEAESEISEFGVEIPGLNSNCFQGRKLLWDSEERPLLKHNVEQEIQIPGLNTTSPPESKHLNVEEKSLNLSDESCQEIQKPGLITQKESSSKESSSPKEEVPKSLQNVEEKPIVQVEKTNQEVLICGSNSGVSQDLDPGIKPVVESVRPVHGASSPPLKQSSTSQEPSDVDMIVETESEEIKPDIKIPCLISSNTQGTTQLDKELDTNIISDTLQTCSAADIGEKEENISCSNEICTDKIPEVLNIDHSEDVHTESEQIMIKPSFEMDSSEAFDSTCEVPASDDGKEAAVSHVNAEEIVPTPEPTNIEDALPKKVAEPEDEDKNKKKLNKTSNIHSDVAGETTSSGFKSADDLNTRTSTHNIVEIDTTISKENTFITSHKPLEDLNKEKSSKSGAAIVGSADVISIETSESKSLHIGNRQKILQNTPLGKQRDSSQKGEAVNRMCGSMSQESNSIDVNSNVPNPEATHSQLHQVKSRPTETIGQNKHKYSAGASIIHSHSVPDKMHHTKQERPSLPDALEKRLHCDLSHLPRIPKKPGTSRPAEEVSSSKEDIEAFDPVEKEVSSKSAEASQETSTIPKTLSRVTSAPGNIFDNMEDSFGYLGSVTLDSDSDDEDLQQTPLALRKCLDGLEDAGSRPVPGTPSKYEVLQDEGDDSLSDDIDSITGKGGDLKPYHYTIDKLLDEKREQEYREHRIVTLEEQLKAPSEESLDGSFDGEADVDDSQASSNLMPQHLETLRRLELKSESISDFHPGELVLDPAKYGCLFHYPGNLTLASCGFEPGSSRIDQNLHNLTVSKPELALDFMTGDIVSLCFDAISCPHAFLSWLFHLVSIVPYSLIAMGVHKLLYEQLCREDGEATTWVPSVKEVARVLVNYGAHLSDICPDSSLLTFQEDDLSLPPAEPPAGQGGNQPGGSLRKENLEIVTETLTAAIHKRPDCYNSQELTALFLMICKLSLEECIRIHMIQHTLKLCLAAILDAYLDEDFSDQVSYLSENVPSLASHHHNKVYLVQLMPYTSRGLLLQKRLAFHTLINLTEVSSIQGQPKMENLCTLVRALNIQQETDYYHLHSVLQLVDIGVGNEPLRGADRPFLKDLMDSLCHLMGGVRDTIQDLDRTKVKDLMVRISTKWQLLKQGTGLQQQGIYTWAQQKQQPPPSVQHVVLQPEEEEEEEEDELEDPTAPD